MSEVLVGPILDGVPVPTRESKYAALGKLRVGQCVVINVPKSSSLSKTIAILQEKTGKMFTRKKVDGGVQVWRIEPADKKPKGKKKAVPAVAPATPPAI